MEYLSLYDYLGKPAGGELGKQVASAASREGIKLETREVSTQRYTGIVYLYPKDFLEFYFRKPDTVKEADPISGDIDWSNSELEDDDLPF
jgi:hypothetical protein